MGDLLKIAKDKRYRSSSSLADAMIEGTRSERKLDITVASIPEGDDKFSIAEARCEQLREKINIVKDIKKKRKLKKRSLTQLSEQVMSSDDAPYIQARTMPKKKAMGTAAQARQRRLEAGSGNPMRRYLDPATLQQQYMVSEMQGYAAQLNQHRTPPPPAAQPINNDHHIKVLKVNTVSKPTRNEAAMRAQGDSPRLRSRPAKTQLEVACGDDNVPVLSLPRSDASRYESKLKKEVKPLSGGRRRYTPRESLAKESVVQEPPPQSRGTTQRPNIATRPQKPPVRREEPKPVPMPTQYKSADVVELFNKNRLDGDHRAQQQTRRVKKIPEINKYEDIAETGPLNEDIDTKPLKDLNNRRRVRRRSHRYELPTVASQMKQANLRYYNNDDEHSNFVNIPFVVTKSTAPSHNIGVNLQQVLNGMKIQQPLSGIPLTIAHHMGLRHVSLENNSKKNGHGQTETLDNREINVIKVGHKLVRLPSYKSISYNKLLTLYSKGEGIVQRFLRALSRPHYFYASMYDLTAPRGEFDGSTSKALGGGGSCTDAKRSLAEYANIYREYEQVDQRIRAQGKEDAVPELLRRRDELARELAGREDQIRRILQDYRANTETDQGSLRASASNAESYRHSSYKLNLAEGSQP